MGSIQIMDEWLSNRIAAGEVVERPASVVKELIENAIDAGSTSIEVFLQEAGLLSIQVIDNGRGMDQADAKHCFMRHATSKIHDEHDLFRIRTLGFRGEALASIASVAKVELITSTGEVGTRLVLEGGKVLVNEPAAARQGTTMTVSQLFYNTPARLKYMKTIQTELSHIMDLLNRLALSNPQIAFRLVHNDHEQLRTNGRGDIPQVLAAIYGVANARKMIHFAGESNDYKISGYATLPELTRASKNYMSFFVNHRWVKHYTIQHAIIEAYHTFLPINRFPIVALYIESDPQLTDVNVHPAKHQIRLSKEKELLALITTTLRRALQEASRVPHVEPVKKAPKLVSEQVSLWQPQKVYEQSPKVEPEEIEWVYHPPIEPPVIEQEILAPPPPKEVLPQLEVVGQIHGTYIVAQMEDGFYLIDQHAAQERIKYEYFRDKVGEVNASERQSLLLPLTFHYAADEATILKEHTAVLEQVGVFLEPFGQNSFVVREYPTWLPKDEANQTIEGLIEQVLQTKKVDIKKLREEAAIMMSCKGSIKANHHLTKQQMEQLLEDLRKADHPFTCPHGRPVLIHFSTTDVEKMFKRIM